MLGFPSAGSGMPAAVVRGCACRDVGCHSESRMIPTGSGTVHAGTLGDGTVHGVVTGRPAIGVS